MNSHGSPTGLMGLRLMEGSPISPTTLRVGLMGLTKLASVEDLVPEVEIAAAVEVARGDYPQWRAAA